MDLSCLARTTHAFIRSQELRLNPIKIPGYFCRLQLGDCGCTALLQRLPLSTLCFLLVPSSEGAAFDEELAAVCLSVAPSVLPIVLFCKLCVEREAEIDEVVGIGPLRKKTTRFA